MSVYYIDTEFDGHGGALLSLAMVGQDGFSLYVTTNEQPNDNWVIANVMPVMTADDSDMLALRVPVSHVGTYIRRFLATDEHPLIVADSPVDIGRFCQAISTGEHGGWASSNWDRLSFEVENVDCYPTTLPGAIQHNAWWDAMALRHKLNASGMQLRENSRSEVEAEGLQPDPKGDAHA